MNKLFTNILIYSSTNILFFSYMQNEPNSTDAGNKFKGPPKVAQLNNQSSTLTVPCAPGINGKTQFNNNWT